MAKGLRAKSKRRYRAVKRQCVAQTVEKDRLECLSARLQLLQQGSNLVDLDIQPPNAFLHPDTAGAVFPQKLPGPPPLDFRCEKVGLLAGLASTHNRRKYTPEEEEDFMRMYDNLPGKTNYPRTHSLRKQLHAERTAADGAMEDGSSEAEETGGERGDMSDAFPGDSASGDAYGLPASMMMTDAMRAMMDRRRKEETSRVPVKVNLLATKKKAEAKAAASRIGTKKRSKKGK
ncbi:conserved hypothetical protein [Neospora caninum Liverpool]|uniref:DUF2423 domain-containing protein n=1 Tax=Neospora caninum (strain Liverpool) TaxID=572307 RepID=F0V8M0_NEOCL|nr:conserved hypothetical protein [Neospora caninum Liverpool]CBZ50061.1 conserved hypothetical protein [Neospora caninum Liverpool]CEL64655.1 TPA: hypothetical protein BN1204_005370 [Neospora caninum Liverpool]|eukprot:XP_003880096.1 conserved hypothetical protein [Neospora caninum Liverpool]